VLMQTHHGYEISMKSYIEDILDIYTRQIKSAWACSARASSNLKVIIMEARAEPRFSSSLMSFESLVWSTNFKLTHVKLIIINSYILAVCFEYLENVGRTKPRLRIVFVELLTYCQDCNDSYFYQHNTIIASFRKIIQSSSNWCY